MQRRWHPGGGGTHLPDGRPRLHRRRTRRRGARPRGTRASTTTGSTIRPTTSSSGASPPSKAAPAALVLASGMAAVSYSILTVARAGSNFVVAPQLYGATFTYFAHVLPTLGIEARFAVDDRAESIGALIDERHLRGVLRVDRQSGRQRRRPRGRGRGGPPRRRAPHRRQHRRHSAHAQAVRSTEPTWSCTR